MSPRTCCGAERWLGEAAGPLGYQSEAAFSRAFKRFVGVPPGQVRRSAAPAGLLVRSAPQA